MFLLYGRGRFERRGLESDVGDGRLDGGYAQWVDVERRVVWYETLYDESEEDEEQ